MLQGGPGQNAIEIVVCSAGGLATVKIDVDEDDGSKRAPDRSDQLCSFASVTAFAPPPELPSIALYSASADRWVDHGRSVAEPRRPDVKQRGSRAPPHGTVRLLT